MRRVHRKISALALAAVVAGCSADFGERPRLQGLAQEPPSPGRDEVTVRFEILDPDHTKMHLVVEYWDGVEWRPATLTGSSTGHVSGNVLADVWPKSTWTSVWVKWDTWADKVQTDGQADVNVRVSSFDADGAGDVDDTLWVTVDNRHPVLKTVEEDLDFWNGVAGLQNPTDQTLQITNDDTYVTGTTLNWSVDSITYRTGEIAGWLELQSTPQALSSGETQAAAFSATCISSPDLSIGTYHATVTIDDPLAHDGPIDIPVTLTVRDPMPAIELSETELTFLFDETVPSDQTFTIGNGGEGTVGMDWSLSDDVGSPDWLDYSPTEGQDLAPLDTPVTVTVSIVDPSALVPGEHIARITATGQGTGTGAPTSTGNQTLTVRLQVATPPTIVYGPGSFSFAGVYGSADPDPRTLSIANSGDRTLYWSASADQGWIVFLPDPAEGVLTNLDPPDSVTVSVNLSGLDAGTHTATITIEGGSTPAGTDASNHPVTIPVTLTIYEF
jgi:hypothetical protein